MNEVHVDLDELGRVRLRRAGEGFGVYTLETTEALRAFFQAERDDALGRWRDPENPDYVVYPRPDQDYHDGSCVLVLDELSGATWLDWERVALPGPARRYFAAHADVEPRKPWHDAKAGEYWLVTLEGADPTPTTVGNYCENLYFVVGDDDYYCPTNDHRIQNAVRLTPEDGDCGISEPTKEGGQ